MEGALVRKGPQVANNATTEVATGPSSADGHLYQGLVLLRGRRKVSKSDLSSRRVFRFFVVFFCFLAFFHVLVLRVLLL